MSSLNDILKDFMSAAKGSYEKGSEDYRQAFFEGRESQGLDPTDAPRISQNFGTNPTAVAARDMMGISNPEYRKAREQMGMGVPKTVAGKAGHMVGAIGNDISRDASRGVWWLLNAPQAVSDVAGEYIVNKANPDLYKSDNTGVSVGNSRQAVADGLVNQQGKMRAGVSKIKGEDGKKYYAKRRYEPGAVAALGIPASIAINSGMGLTNFLGGTDGYTAAVPSDDDLTKTANPLLEVGAKYVLGRTGNLLPWDEFKKVRPDVSKSEYMQYKAFKYNKNVDLNPFDDGQANLPLGIAKFNADGIHGSEVQFLGRSLPVATTIMPTASAIAGTALGVRTGRPIRDGIIGGLAGFTAGRVSGELIERERRNRNERALNMPVTTAIDPETV
jgi:hypothetical protein